MKICAAQIRSVKGDIQTTIEKHKQLINLAVSNGADIIVFPELSLTGYEPELANALATTSDDNMFDPFQEISDATGITIGVGMPTKGDTGILISMLIFQPQQPRQTYSKRYLHEDEYPFFINGQHHVFLNVDNNKIAPAICYESLLAEHAADAFNSGAGIYMASVAKSSTGVAKAYKHLPSVAKSYAMTVVMANCVGRCDNFESAGNTAIWNNKGVLVAQLNDTGEGLLIFDTDTGGVLQTIV